MSEDVDGASVLEVCRTIRCQDGHTYISVIFQADLRDESDDATKKTRTREGSMESHQSGPRAFQEYETSVNDVFRVVRRSVHQSEADSLYSPQ